MACLTLCSILHCRRSGSSGTASRRDLYLRAAAFCDDLSAQQPDGAGDVLVIAHGGTVRVLDAYARGVPVDQMTWPPVENATIVRIPDFGPYFRGGNR